MKLKPIHIAVRVDDELLAKLDALVPQLARDWLDPTRSDAVRYVLCKGFDAIEAEAAREKPKKKPRRTR